MKKFAVGDCVMLRGSHQWRGQTGEIILNPGRAFTGWTVKLGNGHYVGAGDYQMRRIHAV